MRIDTEYPPPIKLKKIELDTLKFLQDEPFICKTFVNLANMARRTYDSYRDPKRLKFAPFNYDLNFDLEWNKWILRFDISTLIETKSDDRARYSRVSHSLAILKKRQNRYILKRKYHFDYDIDGNINDHPIFHMQYAGRLTPSLTEYSQNYDNLFFPALDEPRFICQPMSLALMINLLFKEFKCEKTSYLIEDDRWKDLVKTNEEMILKPYFKCGYLFFNHLSSSFLFSSKYCYGSHINN